MSLVRFRPEAPCADLAHLVERDLAKVEVAGSSPVIRSNNVTRVSSSGNGENADNSTRTQPQAGSSTSPWRHSQAVRQRSAKPLFPGPIPGGASMGEGVFPLPNLCGFSSFGRARPCQGRGGGFEPRNPLHTKTRSESGASYGADHSVRNRPKPAECSRRFCRTEQGRVCALTQSKLGSEPRNPLHTAGEGFTPPKPFHIWPGSSVG